MSKLRRKPGQLKKCYVVTMEHEFRFCILRCSDEWQLQLYYLINRIKNIITHGRNRKKKGDFFSHKYIK